MLARRRHGMGMGNRRVQPVVGNLGKPLWMQGWPRTDLAVGRGDMGTLLGTLGRLLGCWKLGASRLCPTCWHPTVPGVSLEGVEGPSPEPPHGGLDAAWDHVGAAQGAGGGPPQPSGM